VVERNLPKVDVAGSIPASRSKLSLNYHGDYNYMWNTLVYFGLQLRVIWIRHKARRLHSVYTLYKEEGIKLRGIHPSWYE
jgi:hypothetical protein